MHDAAGTVRHWLSQGHRVAFARVINRTGFSGDTEAEFLACNDAGATAGSLLRGTVVPAALDALRDTLVDPAAGTTMLSAHVTTDRAVGAGLSCGGAAQILVQPAATVPTVLWSALADQRPVVLATGIQGKVAAGGSLVVLPAHGATGTLGDPNGDEAVRARAERLLGGAQATTETLDTDGGTVLIEAFIPEPQVIVAGDGALADAIVAQASLLGWSARIVADLDATADALDRAGGSGALAVLSHDVEFGPGALYLALKAPAFYIGALGSRKTQANRATRLKDLGVTDEELAAIHGPIGLDLGGRSPAQVALAICAEILAVRTGRRAVPLATTDGPIRHRA